MVNDLSPIARPASGTFNLLVDGSGVVICWAIPSPAVNKKSGLISIVKFYHKRDAKISPSLLHITFLQPFKGCFDDRIFAYDFRMLLARAMTSPLMSVKSNRD